MLNPINPFPQRLILIIVVILDVVLLAILSVIIGALLPASILPCTYPVAQSFVVAVGLVFFVQLLIGAKLLPRYHKPLFVFDLALLLLVIWLGSYQFAPFGLSDGHSSFVRGFWVTTAAKGRSEIASGEIISLASGSAVSISPILLAGDVRCDWVSAQGGALEDPQSCDTSYLPPQSDYDILKISVRPGCGLPNSIGQIKVSILP